VDYTSFIWAEKVGGIIKLLTMNFLLIGTLFDLLRLCANAYSKDIKGADVQFMNYVYSGQKGSYNDYLKKQSTISDNNGIIWQEGSDKQVAWAERIVTGFLKKSKEIITDASNDNKITPEEADELISALENKVIYLDDANWWIDNRDISIREKMLEVVSDDAELEKIINRVAY
jgi:hypothetical protein